MPEPVPHEPEATEQTAVAVRKFDPSTDLEFVTSSWLHAYRYSPAVRDCPNSIYYEQHHRIISRLLLRGRTFVACAEDQPNVLLGFICCDDIGGVPVVHFVRTKPSFRRFGIARLLFETAFPGHSGTVLFSHSTKMGRLLAKKVDAIYHPYLWLLDG